MKSTTQKLTGLLFILLGFIPLLFVASFKIQKSINRHHMKEKLERVNLQTIVVPEKDVIWVEDDEVRVNGRMFDIKTTRLENGTYTFTGLYDDYEDILIARQGEVAGKNQSENKLLSAVFQCMQDLFYELPAQYSSADNNTHFPNLIPSRLYTFFKTIPTPPPQA